MKIQPEFPLAARSPAPVTGIAWPSPLISIAPPGFDAVTVRAKLELFGPTGSHKDRECANAIASALQKGHSAVGCSSTGNLARALATAAHAAGLNCEVWLSDMASNTRVNTLRELGANVHLVAGGYAEAVRTGNDAMRESGVFNANPSQCSEKLVASRGLGDDILREVRATHIICATNNGSLATGLLRAARRAAHNVDSPAETPC